jgi:hypothetical protein
MVTTKTKQVLQHEPGVQMSVTSPSLLGQLKWMSMRLLLSSVGRLSKGIRLGYRFGFDSGTMLDYVYVNQAQGALGIGVLFDRFYLNAVGWRAIRARSVLLQCKLCQEVERNRAQNAPIRLLDVASGPGRYLQSLLVSCGSETGDLRILCRDLATPGLVQGKKLARERALQHIFYEPGDAFAPASTDELLGGAPNVIVVSGLYELLLDDDLIQRSLKQLYELLAPGGSLYFTTQIQHPQLDFIANVLPNRDGKPWIMKCRPVSLLEEWMQSAGFVQVQSEVEAVGLFAVTRGCKIV